MRDMKEGFYYLSSPDYPENTLVRGYYCSDLNGECVFGFNTYDGGGLIPMKDLTSETTIHAVDIPR